jgi:hypothetical protein
VALERIMSQRIAIKQFPFVGRLGATELSVCEPATLITAFVLHIQLVGVCHTQFLLGELAGSGGSGQFRRDMGRNGAHVVEDPAFAIYVLVMAALILGIDYAFLRGLFWQRLFVNVAIVLLSAAFYMIFLRHS